MDNLNIPIKGKRGRPVVKTETLEVDPSKVDLVKKLTEKPAKKLNKDVKDVTVKVDPKVIKPKRNTDDIDKRILEIVRSEMEKKKSTSN